jgi:uncharacterized membrane protein
MGNLLELGTIMRKYLTALLALLLVFEIPVNVKAASTPEGQPVVHSILFWTAGCTFCEQTLTTILPPIQHKYQTQLSIRLIELASTSDVDNLYALGASLGLTKGQIGVPFLLIDRTALIGGDQIKAGLPDLVQKYLVAGGAQYPDFPLITESLPKGTDFTDSEFYLLTNVVSAATPTNAGMSLAWVVIVFMLVALIAAIALIVRAFQGKPLAELTGWTDWIIPILALIGLGASIYLTSVELTHTRALCGPVGDCNAVQSSLYAKLFGVLPIGIVGAIGYIAILVAWFWRRPRTGTGATIAGPVMFGMALFGTLFSIYLTYLELFVIHAVCIWCLSSAVIIATLMLLSLPPLTQWLAITDEED